MCIVICEHQARELLSIVDRALILSECKIIAEGSPSSLLKNEKAKLNTLETFSIKFNNAKINLKFIIVLILLIKTSIEGDKSISIVGFFIFIIKEKSKAFNLLKSEDVFSALNV